MIWGRFGVDREWTRLRSVLLHRPGPEVAVEEPDAAQMLAPVDWERAAREHDALAEAYRALGVRVEYVGPGAPPRPNQLFVADLLFMTPEGAVLARPASTVRAGEEVEVQRALARLAIPVLGAVGGAETFEGADAQWLDPGTVLVGVGFRTSEGAARRLTSLLEPLAVRVVPLAMRPGAMHLMGCLRLLDRDLAAVWPGREPDGLVELLESRGFSVIRPGDAEELEAMAMNVVPVGPRRVVMPACRPRTRRLFERHGVECIEVPVDELVKAAGGIACMTGVLERETAAGAG